MSAPLKVRRVGNSKTLPGKSQPLSATSAGCRKIRKPKTRSLTPPSSAKGAAGNRRESAKKRYKKLQPWLDFAYLPDTSIRDFYAALVKRFGGSYRADEPYTLSSLARLSRVPRDERRLRGAMETAKFFRALLEKLPAVALLRDDDPFLAEAEGEPVLFSAQFMAIDDGEGRLGYSIDPLYRDFMNATGRIEFDSSRPPGTELRRWKRCEVCGRMFFSLRFKPGSKHNSKACSFNCNRVHRMRLWREKQLDYELNRLRRTDPRAAAHVRERRERRFQKTKNEAPS